MNNDDSVVVADVVVGRELDATVAKRVMGWREGDHPEKNGTGQWMSEYGEPVYFFPEGGFRTAGTFCPSDDIAAAMEVVNHFQSHSMGTLIHVFGHTTQVLVEMQVPSSECQEWGETMAEAICRCALKAQEKWNLFSERVAALQATSTDASLGTEQENKNLG